MTILILAGREDAQAVRVASELRALRHPFRWLDTVSFPERVRGSIRDGNVYVSGRALATPASIYLRGLACHPLIPDFHEDLLARPRGLVAQCEEKRAFLESMLLIFERKGAWIVNTLAANRQHGCKPMQLNLLQCAGLPVPRWIATNDAAAAKRFVRTAGPCVYKPLAGGAMVRMVEQADLAEDRLAALALAPVVFQQYYPGVSMRAFVVGRRVVAAAEIHSSEVDYRRDEQAVVPVRLSREERQAALAAAKACNMAFTGVDFIRGADGFRILECNPSPMFAVFEEKTGLDVSGPLAQFLAR